MRKKCSLILILLGLFTTSLVQAQLSGNYTIDATLPIGGTNYQSFGGAQAALNTLGVSGAVVFNVAEGTYTENVVLTGMTGTNATNTITFQANAANANPVVLTSANGTNIFRFTGASYITISGISIITAAGADSMNVISLGSGAHDISITNCSLIGVDVSTLTTAEQDIFNNAVVFDGGGVNDSTSNITINNCIISNGSNAILIAGNTNSKQGNWNISNNFITNYHASGINVTRSNNIVATNNTITCNNATVINSSGVITVNSSDINVSENSITSVSSSSTNFMYGVYTAADSSITITSNTVVAENAGRSIGLYATNTTGDISQSNLIANNSFSVTAPAVSNSFGVYLLNTNDIDFVFNSVLYSGGVVSNRALYVNETSTSSNIRILNNSVVNTGGGWAIDISPNSITSGAVIASDYNNFFGAGRLCRYNNVNLTTLSAYQTASNLDANSISADPLYISNTDLHVSANSPLIDSGTTFSTVTTDIDGDIRTSPEDIGADEYVMPAPTCLPPTALIVSDIGVDSAVVSWTSGGSALGYNIEFGASGFGQGSGSFIAGITDTFFTITGLTSATVYDFYVRDSCGTNDVSTWSGPQTFTTTASTLCGSPTALVVSNIGSDTVVVSWTSGGSALGHNIEYGASGFSQGSGNLITGITDTFYTISGLTGSTSYDFYVQDSCSATGFSAFTGPQSFTTLFPPVCSLSGTYSINSAVATGGTNYASFTEASADLANCGIAGAVVFEVSGGTYTENLNLPVIIGSNVNNTVTFKPNASNTSPVILQSSTGTSVVQLNQTGFITLEGLNVSTMAGADSMNVISLHGAHDLTIKNCVLTGIDVGTLSLAEQVLFQNAVVLDGGGINDSTYNVNIDSNTINNGSDGIAIVGNVSSRQNNFNIGYNLISNFYGSGVLISRTTDVNVSGNTMTSNNTADVISYGINSSISVDVVFNNNIITAKSTVSTDFVYGIISNVDSLVTITNNTVLSENNGRARGIVVQNDVGSATQPILVANNMVSCFAGAIANSFGVYINNCNYVDFVFNSVVYNSTIPSNRSLFINEVASGNYGNIRVLNNSLEHLGAGWVYDISAISVANSSVIASDYNNFFGAGRLLRYDGVNLTTLAAFQTASNLDANSINADPLYTSNTDLHISANSPLVDAASVFASITTDIDGDTRTAPQDIGADEYVMSVITCPAPTALIASNITLNTADVSWTSGGSAQGYNIEYGITGFAPGTGTLIKGVTSTSLTLTNLVSTMTYDFYVRDSCGVGDFSTWSGPQTFTTLTPVTSCASPLALTSSSIGPDSAVVSWTSGGLAAGYNIEYGPVGFVRGSGTLLTGLVDTFYTITNLSIATSYDFYVQDSCTSGDVSLWVGPQNFITTTAAACALAGTYTIDGSLATGGTNYATFAEATADAVGCGISASVTFNVAEGTYSESIVIDSIFGTSVINQIIFQPNPSNVGNVIISNATTGAVLRFTGASYITFTGMNLTANADSNMNVVAFSGNNHDIAVTNCVLNGLPLSKLTGALATNYFNAVIFEGGGATSVANNITVENNTITNGSYGVFISGATTPAHNNIIFKNNDVQNFAYRGFNVSYCSDLQITNNLIVSNPLAQELVSGIRLTDNINTVISLNDITCNTQNGNNTYGIYLLRENSASVLANKIIANVSGGGRNYGLWSQTSVGTAAKPNLFANNMISCSGATIGSYSMYIISDLYTDIVHNSLYYGDGNAASKALYLSSDSVGNYGNINVINNALVTIGDGYAYDINKGAVTLGYVNSSNYNDLYSTGKFVKYDDVDQATLNDYQNASGLDANSIDQAPLYTSSTDLSISILSPLVSAGTVFSGVNTDINGEARVNPEIGADELFGIGLFEPSIKKDSHIFAYTDADFLFVNLQDYTASRQVNISLYSVNGQAVVRNLQGEKGSITSVNLSKLPRGIYILKVLDVKNNQVVHGQKIVR